ncbi:MmgE/PrpD family protein [Sphingomonas sp. CGMCC 1.13654]|uniref:MmgE/PrpD family protein n=1 Tax=Sphingomonas chungangi TaxID=2683589 RepID=A0A838L9E2_9SPHN|nr:MmgE/PrpD family protein [Sphingomonas chungangi]MBA2935520.1 MmgE/PrpD family protein [Sphingomonas chungangi]MVW57027.1 MmgE/PrpD family protein [Sphingomonas chungangi]
MKHENPVHPSQDPAGELARMVAETRFEDLDAEVIDLAKRAIMDTLAVTIAGSGWEVTPAIAALAAEWGGKPEATILVHGHRVPAPLAAFANGVMARAIDMGDVHETGGHVTEWNVPAMMSVIGIAGRPVTGKEFIAAYVTGAEVGVRASAALNLVRYHTTWGMPGEWNGPLCATASVSRLLGLSADETWNALGMAYTVHGMSEYNKYSEGTQMARVQHAFAGDTAVKAALLTRAGVTAPRGVFQGVPSGILRHIAWDDVQPELLTDGLGTRWQLTEGLSMKPYSACKFTHSFIASTAAIMAREELDHRQIESIECVGSDASRMTFEPAAAKWNPRSVPEAMFSAPYTIASAAITGGFFLDDLNTAEIMRDDKRDLMRRVSIVSDPSITDQFEGFPVTITMRDGRRFTHVTPYTKGHTRNPMTWTDLQAKLERCAGFAAVSLPEPKLDRLVELCRNLEGVQDVQSLVESMTA